MTALLQNGRQTRVVSLDGLRGLAALSVVAYHYTTRFDELYASGHRDVVGWPLGFYGVHLFFMISGFVIFMTVERCARVRDFALSRFIRLYPLYWACVVLTWVVVQGFGPDDRAVGGGALLVNLTMFQSWVGADDVDGVYWTLAVEMSFYLLMAAAMAANCLRGRRLVVLLGGWLAVGVLLRSRVAGALPGHDYVAFHLSAGYCHLFVIGICLYIGWRDGHSRWTVAGIVAGLAVAVAGGGVREGLIILGLVAVFTAALQGWLSPLRWKPLQLLGVASYALYLIHQNVGYAVLAWLEGGLRVPAPLSVAATMVAAVLVSWALTRWLDVPAQAAVRRIAQRSRVFGGGETHDERLAARGAARQQDGHASTITR